MTMIYAILDKVSNDLIGGLHLHKHDAAAIRIFGDIASAEGTMINQHPKDFVLLKMGELFLSEDDEWEIVTYAATTPVMTGEAWLAAQQPQED